MLAQNVKNFKRFIQQNKCIFYNITPTNSLLYKFIIIVVFFTTISIFWRFFADDIAEIKNLGLHFGEFNGETEPVLYYGNWGLDGA